MQIKDVGIANFLKEKLGMEFEALVHAFLLWISLIFLIIE